MGRRWREFAPICGYGPDSQDRICQCTSSSSGKRKELRAEKNVSGQVGLLVNTQAHTHHENTGQKRQSGTRKERQIQNNADLHIG